MASVSYKLLLIRLINLEFFIDKAATGFDNANKVNEAVNEGLLLFNTILILFC
jgi:hypothetical protein